MSGVRVREVRFKIYIIPDKINMKFFIKQRKLVWFLEESVRSGRAECARRLQTNSSTTL